MSRPHNDGSGRQNYFGNAVDHRDAVVDMEGMMASNYNDSNINRTALSTEAVEDVQIKTGGVDAASPMGTIDDIRASPWLTDDPLCAVRTAASHSSPISVSRWYSCVSQGGGGACRPTRYRL